VRVVGFHREEDPPAHRFARGRGRPGLRRRQTKADFLRLKAKMLRVGDVKTFENFVVPMPAAADPAAYNTVIVWCESFGQFITAAQYR
jgi:hypothetical protein